MSYEIDSKLNKIITSFRNVVPQLEKEVFDQLSNYRHEIVSLNKGNLSKGLNQDGANLGTYSNFEYKKRWSPVDLYLTGEFHKSIKVVFKQKSFEIFSSDKKKRWLIPKYGADIVGISNKNLFKYVGMVMPKVLNKVNENIQNSI